MSMVCKCDRCGAEIEDPGRRGYIWICWKPYPEGEPMEKNPYEDKDYCEDCIRDMIITLETPPVRQKPKSGEKGIDKGKVRALWRAGRSVKWIADEMRCSHQYISKLTKEFADEEEED